MPITEIKCSKATPAKAIAYITHPDKASMKAVMNLNLEEDFAEQMMRTAKWWGKAQNEKDRKYYHMKICFAPKDLASNGGKLTEKTALRVGERVIEEFFANHHVVLAVHTDTDCMHVHVIIGAVNPLTGALVNMRDSEYRRFKDRTNEIAVEYGLSAIDWRKATQKKREEEKQSVSPETATFAELGIQQRNEIPWKDKLRTIIDKAVAASCSMHEFRQMLKEHDVVLTRCTDQIISYKLGNHRACRGDTLGGDYTMLAIQSALAHNSKVRCDGEVGKSDSELYREWGRMAGIRRSEIDAICDNLHRATWQQKQEVWTEYKQRKEGFWDDYRKRKVRLKADMDEAYYRRREIKDAEWALSPYNRYRSLGGIVFAAIVLRHNGSQAEVEKQITMLREQQAALSRECRLFKSLSDEALATLRRKNLSLNDYLATVERMQNVADFVFSEVNEEMAMWLWRIEQSARVKQPSLEELLKNADDRGKDNGTRDVEIERTL